MPTIEQIAAVSGVSPATVSRVLRNAHNVAPATKELVLKTAAELGRTLPSELQAKKILAIGPASAQKVFAALDNAAYENRISLLWKIAQSDDYLADDLISLEDYDGIIVVDGVISPQLLQSLREKLPVVQCRTYSGLDSDVAVLVDDFQMGFDLTEYMIRQGCKKIMYLKQPAYFDVRPFAKDRLRGAHAAACEYGVPLDRVCSIKLFSDADALVRQAVEEGVDGILFGMMASTSKSVFNMLNEMQIRIPEDLKIASFDDVDICEILDITAARQSYDSLAKLSIMVLRDLMEGRIRPTEPILIRAKHHLIERSSTKNA